MQKSSETRKVKIVCTLGPSSNTPERIEALIRAGMDIARLNFSHGDHAFHRNLIQTIRAASQKVGRPVAIMQDLQGPKIRAGKLGPNGVELNKGDTIVLHPEGSPPASIPAGARAIPVSAEIAAPVARDAQVGARILFDDGKIATRATAISGAEITAVESSRITRA